MRNIPLFLLVLMCFVGCRTTVSQQITSPSGGAGGGHQPDTTLIPAFSGEVLYLFGREYLAIYDSLSPKFNHPHAARVRQEQLTMAAYVEHRLREWYPEVAYEGMLAKWHQIALQLTNAPEAEMQLFVNTEFDRQTVQGNFNLSGSDTEESACLRMTAEEQRFFNQINTLAESEHFVHPTSLPKASYSTEREQSCAFTPDIHDTFERENILASLMWAGGPYALYRVLLSKQRAERQAKEYYGLDTNSGKQGDAFKHMYVNVLLRAYTSSEIAAFVMDEVWEQWHVNAPCDRYMDLHNNQIGRTQRYWDFHQNTDDWKEWGSNVHQFVQDSLNSSFKEWNKETAQFKVLYDSRNTPAEQYIYWNTETIDPR